jgi:hypothetical protein
VSRALTSRIAHAVGAWAIGLAAAAVARAHGGPPIIEAALAHDGDGPLVVELSEGFALRAEDASWSFVCPALFGVDLPPPSTSIAGEAWLAAADDLYRIGPSRAPIALGRPDLAGRVLALSALGDAPLVLRLRSPDEAVAGSEVVRAEGELVEIIYATPTIWSALAVLQPSRSVEAQLWLARLEADSIELLGLTTDGVEIDRQLALLSAEPLSVRLSTAGEHVFAHVVENGGYTLLHVATRGEPPFTAVEVVHASLPVRGPALRHGEIVLTRDDELLSWTPEAGVAPSESALGTQTLTCITPDLACTSRALYDADAVEAANGFEDADMLLDLAHLAPPELAPDDAALRQQCDLQWQVFRADLVRTGVMTLGEPEPPHPDAGTDAGSGGGVESDAGAPLAPAASDGCSIRPARSGDGWLALLWLAVAALVRRARAQLVTPSTRKLLSRSSSAMRAG